jgi:hypothetical protein
VTDTSESPTLCACGCGQPVTPKNNGHRTAPRYILGHSSRDPKRMAVILAKRNAWISAGRPPVPTYICQCGCGQVIPPRSHHRWSPPTYLPGHYQKIPDGAFQRGVRAIRGGRRKSPPPGWVPPSGWCACGCGGKTEIAERSLPRYDTYIGYPKRYIHGHNRKDKKGFLAPGWKGGKRRRTDGYIQVWAPDFPDAPVSGYVPEHRVVYAESRSVRLPPGVVIHHLNGQKEDNRPENLIATTRAEHARTHRLANQLISLFLDDRLLEAAKAHVREHGTLPDLEALTAQVYGHR